MSKEESLREAGYLPRKELLTPTLHNDSQKSTETQGQKTYKEKDTRIGIADTLNVVARNI